MARVGGPSFFASADSTALTGDPSSISLGMYALYVSPNADCSSYTTLVDHGATADYKDFATNPTLFEASPTDGTYQCVALRMSDVIRFQPASTFVGTGSDSLPIDDHVTIIMTTDTTAAMARGFSAHQIVPLASGLVVPGSSTF